MNAMKKQPTKRKRDLAPTTIRLEPKVREQLDTMAKRQGMTLGAYLRWLVEEQICYAEAA